MGGKGKSPSILESCYNAITDQHETDIPLAVGKVMTFTVEESSKTNLYSRKEPKP